MPEYLPPFEYPEIPPVEIAFFTAWLPDLEASIPVTPTIDRPEDEV